MTDDGRQQAIFEVRIEGAVPDDILDDLQNIQVVTRELRTSLRAHIRDQSELHGFLAQLRTYGLEVVEVRRVVTPDEEPEGEPS